MLTNMAFLLLTFFSEDLAGVKTTKARKLQALGQWKANIKVIEVKGQGHFAIFLVKKIQFLQLMI